MEYLATYLAFLKIQLVHVLKLESLGFRKRSRDVEFNIKCKPLIKKEGIRSHLIIC